MSTFWLTWAATRAALLASEAHIFRLAGKLGQRADFPHDLDCAEEEGGAAEAVACPRFRRVAPQWRGENRNQCRVAAEAAADVNGPSFFSNSSLAKKGANN